MQCRRAPRLDGRHVLAALRYRRHGYGHRLHRKALRPGARRRPPASSGSRSPPARPRRNNPLKKCESICSASLDFSFGHSISICMGRVRSRSNLASVCAPSLFAYVYRPRRPVILALSGRKKGRAKARKRWISPDELVMPGCRTASFLALAPCAISRSCGQARRPSARMGYGHRLPNSLPSRCDTRNWVNDAKSARQVQPRRPAATPQPSSRIAHGTVAPS